MVAASTALGLLVSCFVKSQLAAIFATAIIAMIPSMNYSGFLYPMSTLSGGGYVMGRIFPASWYLTVSLGTFGQKASPCATAAAIRRHRRLRPRLHPDLVPAVEKQEK